jgi:hypothetical protein
MHIDDTEQTVQAVHIAIYAPIQPSYDIATYTADKTNNITCSICLEEQKINEQWTKLRCEHEFHKSCIINWLTVNNICPVCRHLIDTQ